MTDILLKGSLMLLMAVMFTFAVLGIIYFAVEITEEIREQVRKNEHD